MIQIVPETRTKIEEDVKRAIFEIIGKYNINRDFCWDSESINNSIGCIARKLYKIKSEAKPQFDKETLKQFGGMRKAINKKKK